MRDAGRLLQALWRVLVAWVRLLPHRSRPRPDQATCFRLHITERGEPKVLEFTGVEAALRTARQLHRYIDEVTVERLEVDGRTLYAGARLIEAAEKQGGA